MNYKVMGACVAVFLSIEAQGMDNCGDLFVEDASPRVESNTNSIPSVPVPPVDAIKFETPMVKEKEPDPLLWGVSPSPAKPAPGAPSAKPKGVLSWSPSPGPVVNTAPEAEEMLSLLLWGKTPPAAAGTLATPTVENGFYSPPKKRGRSKTLTSPPSSADLPGSASTSSTGTPTPTSTKKGPAILLKRQKSAISPYAAPSTPSKKPDEKED